MKHYKIYLFIYLFVESIFHNTTKIEKKMITLNFGLIFLLLKQQIIIFNVFYLNLTLWNFQAQTDFRFRVIILWTWKCSRKILTKKFWAICWKKSKILATHLSISWKRQSLEKKKTTCIHTKVVVICAKTSKIPASIM